MHVMAKKRPKMGGWPERLRALRERLDLTQAQAAEKVGVTRRAWIAWETGEKIPSAPLAILIGILERHPGIF
jgi:DNA-binding XRE family transcriptional regulator